MAQEEDDVLLVDGEDSREAFRGVETVNNPQAD